MSIEKAVILAGGKGSRLYPLTATTPKPLLPVNNIPAISRIMRNIEYTEIKNAVITLGFMGQKIEDVYRDVFRSLSLEYSYDDMPLGTAGSVKKAVSSVAGDVLVLSGDAIFEGKLNEVIDFHYKNNADVTIVAKTVENPSSYGVIICDGNRVSSFEEKPSAENCRSNLVNAGIYILSKNVLKLIPDGVYDFGKELFPKVLELGMDMYAFETSDFWCDIGTPSAYYDCNMRYSGDKSVFGSNCNLSAGASIYKSVILDNVTIGADTDIKNSIICNNVKIADGVSIGEGCVIGENSTVYGNIAPGTLIEPESIISEQVLEH